MKKTFITLIALLVLPLMPKTAVAIDVSFLRIGYVAHYQGTADGYAATATIDINNYEYVNGHWAYRIARRVSANGGSQTLTTWVDNIDDAVYTYKECETYYGCTDFYSGFQLFAPGDLYPGKSWTASNGIKTTVLGVSETLSTPAGVFKDCVRILREYDSYGTTYEYDTYSLRHGLLKLQGHIYDQNVSFIIKDVYLPPAMPENYGITPSTGQLTIGQPVTLEATYVDDDGPQDLQSCHLLINSSFVRSKGCAVYFDPALNKLYLCNDTGTGWLGGFAPGSNNVIENSYCKLYCASTSLVTYSDGYGVKWRIEMKPAMAGRVTDAWLFCADKTGNKTTWEDFGGFTIAVLNQKPANVSVAPQALSLAPGEKKSLLAVYSDADGAADFRGCYLLLNSALSTVAGCDFYYDAVANRLYLLNDAGTSWLGGFTPGSANVLENSYCKLYCAQTTVSSSANNKSVNWCFELKATMKSKALTTWMYCRDKSGVADGWDALGSVNVTSGNAAPVNVIVSPWQGSLSTNVKFNISTISSDANGYGDLRRVLFLINTSLSGSNGIYLLFDEATNKMYLRNDTDTVWLGGYTPGSGYTISNSYCTLDCLTTTFGKSGNNLRVNWRITLKSAMAGKACKSWLYTIDDQGLTDPWDQLGVYSVP